MTVVMIAVAVIVAAGLFRTLHLWNRNNKQPVLSVRALVVGRRFEAQTRRHSGDDNASQQTQSYTYYVTFEVESGDRMEFAIEGRNYGLIAEGDLGKLTFQGTRYFGFDRDNNRLGQMG
ncbi:hypothetical protein VN24_15495 [Paenibacillus beijingensis]|uniref:DUF2500 domain-containing protein n=2 Tax=Paenibacillus beijingensis TaxID=1126833 RepID=A0A0D5NRJ4_9BACL|nr:hypothetical protein VN24_15495 [Paenibacillus beijingensis]